MLLNEKIANLRTKMAQHSPNSPIYSNYQSLINDLEKEVPKQVTLHKDSGAVCEACE